MAEVLWTCAELLCLIRNQPLLEFPPQFPYHAVRSLARTLPQLPIIPFTPTSLDTTMTHLELATTYFNAWNARDGAAIAATFAPEGTYRDPSAGEIPAASVGAYAKRLWEAFPDLTFDVVSAAEAGPGRVVAEWVMKGTNTGAFHGLPPTGRAVSLPGVDVIECGADGIASVKGYFDSRSVVDQLGLQVVVQPHQVGPFSFGVSTAVSSGRKVKPGAFCITTIWNPDEETDEIRALSRDTAREMLGMEGFIGVVLARIGGRGITISAWERPEQTRQLMKGGTHSDAVKRFWKELSDSAFTSIWVPERFNPLWVRCTACGKMVDHEGHQGLCPCGGRLAEPPPYF